MTRSAPDYKLAVFCAGTEDYLPYMATALCSIKHCNTNKAITCFVLGRDFRASSLRFLERHGIEFLNLDLSDVFVQPDRSRYPSECFWHLQAPELFHARGFEFSLAVDGDIWCNQGLALDWLADVEHLAGASRGCSVERFLGASFAHLARVFEITPAGGERTATNSGVVFYNNANLVRDRFFEKALAVYRGSIAAGIPRPGDDTTLSLTLAVHPELKMKVLGENWNAYRDLHRRFSRRDPRYRTHLAHWPRQVYLVHHLRIKPWRQPPQPPNRVQGAFAAQWRGLYSQIMRPRRRSRTAQAPTVKPARLPLIYWYRGRRPNFGDEIAPYLAAKLMGLRLGAVPKLTKDPAACGRPVLLSVGSVLRLCAPNTVVWGAGIRDYRQRVAPAYRFCAVRGPLTRRRLLELGYECPPVYGDPALLLPRFFKPPREVRHALGIIPHVNDYQALAEAYRRDPDVRVIDLATANIEQTVTAILSCDSIVSSSLHGLVIAVAYGVPTRWLCFSDNIKGDNTKFYDFFASLVPELQEVLEPATMRLQPGVLPWFEPFTMDAGVPSAAKLRAQTHLIEQTLPLGPLLDACPIGRAGWLDSCVNDAAADASWQGRRHPDA